MDNMDLEGPDDPEWTCKHCPAVGMDCPDCEEGLNQFDRLCRTYNGAGVLHCGTEETENQLLEENDHAPD